MNTKHTPGPWVAEMRYINDIPGNARVEVMAGSKHEDHMNSAVASVCYSHTPCRFYIDDKDEAEANARLIAAAPDLLEALEGFVAEFGDKAVNANVKKARAAIAKATGDNP